MNQSEFSDVKGDALNQAGSPERMVRWRIADPFETGAGEMPQAPGVKDCIELKRTDNGTTRRVSGRNILYNSVHSKDGGVTYGTPM